jgi:hypothetical protein
MANKTELSNIQAEATVNALKIAVTHKEIFKVSPQAPRLSS